MPTSGFFPASKTRTSAMAQKCNNRAKTWSPSYIECRLSYNECYILTNRCINTYIYIHIYAFLYGCESRPHFVAAPPPPTPCYIPLCRGMLLLQIFVANAWRRYALQKNLVAKVLVARQEILLQTYVSEWPPKPVTNPVFLIHSHVYR